MAVRDEHSVDELEQLRTLFQAVIDDNQPLLAKPSQQTAAARRIAEATQALQSLDREIAERRN